VNVHTYPTVRDTPRVAGDTRNFLPLSWVDQLTAHAPARYKLQNFLFLMFLSMVIPNSMVVRFHSSYTRLCTV
jgi:hypothetical protein